MKLTILRNPGRAALASLGTTEAIEKTLVEGATVDVSDKIGNALIKLRLAEAPTVVRAVPEPPAIRGVTGDFKKLDEGHK